MEVGRCFALLVACSMLSCAGESKDEAQARHERADEQAQARDREAAQREADHEACRRLRGRVDSFPALAGTPRLDEQRHRVLGQAKGWPVVFRRPPVRDLDQVPAYFRVLAESLDDPRRAFSAFETLRGRARHHRKEVRAILLPEGYLYAEDPEVARWLVTHLDLERLFEEPEIWLMRGDGVHRLIRSEQGYRHADGPSEGSVASLLLFDRVAVRRTDLFPVLHADFVPAAERAGFDRVRLERVTSEGIKARVRYGAEDRWADAVFTEVDGRVELACEVVEEDLRDGVLAFRAHQHVRETAAEHLRRAMEAQVRERLLFDEPREEVGQQDGSLRPLWLWAYRHGGDGYSFNKVWYPVFDTQGRPHPPQVCIDFVLDTYERASGTWFAGRNEERKRVTGRVDFERFEMPNRRSVEAVADYFRSNPGMFSLWDLEPEQRIRFAQREAFYDFLRDHADRFRVGDVVLIHGPRGGEAHYHSFIVSRSDPITGMPVEVAENAGKPRLRSWHSAMQSGPLRSIRNVMTPELTWLRQVFAADGQAVALVTGEPSSPPGAPQPKPPSQPVVTPN
jgi:hypothetical protein